MKELSIEEKAKRYESALERCRKLYNEAKANEYTSDIEDYETIFPELKESEDERIRKEIIAHIKWCEDSGYCAKEEMTRWITWLEKQAQKPFGFNNGDTIDHNLNDYCCKIYSALHKENGGVLSFARLQHMAMDIYGWCKRQGEQKVWSEEDEKMLSQVINEIEAIKSNSQTVFEKNIAQDKIDWLKSLRPQSQWKPSDEQMDKK